MLNIEKIKNLLQMYGVFMLLLCAMPVRAWDTPPQNISTYSHWTSETSVIFNLAAFSFIDDGSSQLRVSLTPPTEGSEAGTIAQRDLWTYLDGKVVVKVQSYKDANNTTKVWFRIGGVTRDDKNALIKGMFYIWYGKQSMATVNYEMWYDPFPIVTAPAGIIDLGTCHKSFKGNILSKPFSVDINIYGYLNGASYGLTRTFNFGALPAGASFTDSNGQTISAGNVTTLNAAITEPPYSITDTFNARLDCDKANAGVQTWVANIVYTAQ